jgi:D-3-phosphoglycerate dehydrogenase / 2-oxoglutarate reductase
VPKAVYFRMLQYAEESLVLLERAFDLTVLETPAELTGQILNNVEVLFAPLGHRFDASLMKRCPKLRVIATNTTGVPHIDVEYATRCGIKVISLKDQQEFLRAITPTAELTIGLIICVTRKLLPAREAVLQGRWRRWDFGGPAMLSRMSLGIIGLGRLGRMVARSASAMGMQVHYYDPYIAQPPLGTTTYRRSDTLENLVSRCDVTSIHVPMAAENRHLLDRRIFEQFKPGAYLVNTARGEIVDSTALIGALETGRLAGAALDVLDGEFEPGFEGQVLEHPLVRYAKEHDNLLITPHIAGSTQDAWHLTQRFTVEQAIVAAKHQ